MINQSEPTYSDQRHPIYRAWPIAVALDRLDEFNFTGGDTDIEAALIDAGEAAGGLAHSFKRDLLQHVMTAERHQDEAIFDEAASHGHRGFYDANGEPCPEAYRHVCDTAEAWIADVTATLARHGLEYTGEITKLASNRIKETV